jgi:hypothetical protein
MCFVWISEQTAIISLYSINWLVFITETECVYCAVRTESLTFNNSTFCPHSVFMCFVWISEQTGVVPLYSINGLVFCKINAVFTARYELDPLNSIPVNLRRLLLNAEASVRSQANRCETFGGQSDTGTGLSPSISVSTCQYHSFCVPFSSSSTCGTYQKDKGANPGELIENRCSFKKGAAGGEGAFSQS